MKDYSMYRYYKGEKENPFNKENQNTSFMFWFYEKHFDDEFAKNESSDWHAFFGGNNSETSKAFMKLLSEDDYARPAEKKKEAIFQLWLEKYLFVEKLYGEYGSENWYKKKYYAIAQ